MDHDDDYDENYVYNWDGIDDNYQDLFAKFSHFLQFSITGCQPVGSRALLWEINYTDLSGERLYFCLY